MIHQPFPPPGFTALFTKCHLPHLLLLPPILALLLLITYTLRSRRSRQRQDPEQHHPLASDAKYPLAPPPPYPSHQDPLSSYAASYAYTDAHPGPYTDDLPPPLRSTLPIPLSASGRPFTSADLVRSPWWGRRYFLGSRSAVVAELLVGDAGERREREEKVRVTETRGWVPLGAAEAGEMGEEDGMAEAEAEGQGRQVRRAGRRRRMLVFEGLGADGGNEQRVDGQDTVVVESDTRVEAPRTSAVQEADVWSAMRGVEIEI